MIKYMLDISDMSRAKTKTCKTGTDNFGMLPLLYYKLERDFKIHFNLSRPRDWVLVPGS